MKKDIHGKDLSSRREKPDSPPPPRREYKDLGLCKTCKFFDKNSFDGIPDDPSQYGLSFERLGACKSNMFSEGDAPIQIAPGGLHGDYSDWEGRLVFHEDFGCIHHETKEK